MTLRETPTESLVQELMVCYEPTSYRFVPGLADYSFYEVLGELVRRATPTEPPTPSPKENATANCLEWRAAFNPDSLTDGEWDELNRELPGVVRRATPTPQSAEEEKFSPAVPQPLSPEAKEAFRVAVKRIQEAAAKPQPPLTVSVPLRPSWGPPTSYPDSAAEQERIATEWEKKEQKLKESGYQLGSFADFLGLSPEEKERVEAAATDSAITLYWVEDTDETEPLEWEPEPPPARFVEIADSYSGDCGVGCVIQGKRAAYIISDDPAVSLCDVFSYETPTERLWEGLASGPAYFQTTRRYGPRWVDVTDYSFARSR